MSLLTNLSLRTMWLPLNKCIMFVCSSFHKSISYSTLVCDHDVLSLTCGRLMRITGSCLWETVETAFLQPDQLIITKGYRTRSRIHDLIQEIWHSFSFKQILLRGELYFSPLAPCTIAYSPYNSYFNVWVIYLQLPSQEVEINTKIDTFLDGC